MKKPIRKSFSRKEAIKKAQEWMLANYGRPIDLEPAERDKWHERFGMMVDLFIDMFPVEE